MKVNQKGFGLTSVIVLLVLLLLVGLVYFRVQRADEQIESSNKPQVTNFNECVAAGNPVMESYPEQCAVNGQTFINENQNKDFVALDEIETTYIPLSSTEQSLQSKVKEIYLQSYPDCVVNGELKASVNQSQLVTNYKVNKYATVLFNCDEYGASGLLVVKDAVWQLVMTTQEGYTCSVLQDYNVPIEATKPVGINGNDCLLPTE